MVGPAISDQTAKRFPSRESTLKLDAEGQLSGSIAAEVRPTSRGNQAKTWVGYVEDRGVQVRVIQNIGEGSFSTQMHALCDGQLFAESGGEVHRARPHQVALALVTETSDRRIDDSVHI